MEADVCIKSAAIGAITKASMLLWVLIVLALRGHGPLLVRSKPYLPPLRSRGVLVGTGCDLASRIFCLLSCLTFVTRICTSRTRAPFDGQDLNPLLANPGLAFHPPFCIFWYVGLSMTFSFAVDAAPDTGVSTPSWGRWVRSLDACGVRDFLTIGSIALGVLKWAYYELAWGGFVLGSR